jgi:hypothetical protein
MDKLEFQADSIFFELPELTNLSLADLQKLWDSIPTEDQAYLSRVFEREADKRQVVEDIDEARMSQYFLEQYLKLGFVPSGDVWLKVPLTIREQYKLPLAEKLDAEEKTSSVHEKQPAKTQIPKWLLILAVPFACLMIFTLMRSLTGNSDDANTSAILVTETPSPTASPTATVTSTALPPSPTPFGLTGFDDAIRSGSPSNRDYYPVQLQVFSHPNALPRVFIVQEQEIGLADWRFVPNPDIVSWLSGMIVRPVLGMPFSQANLELFQSISEESVFVVTMNTGAVLQFTNPRSHLVGRAETSYFRQDSPGLVLVLIGETFADGSPTDIRYLLQADYPVEQELSYLATIQPAIIPMGTSQALGDFDLTVTEAQLSPSPNLPPELLYALVNIQVLSGENPIDLAIWQWFLELATGERISLEPNISGLGTCLSLATTLPANTSSCFTLALIVPHQLETARLLVGNSGENFTAFELQFSAAPVIVSPSNLDVQLGRISYTSDSLRVTARVYNPTNEAITISAQDFSLILGFVPNPTGFALPPVFASQTVEPSSALDLSLEFPYAGEGYASLSLLNRLWAISIEH